MDYTTIIILYIILLVMLLAATWKMGVRLFSAVVISFLLAGIFLMILIPPNDIDRYTDEVIDGYDHDNCDSTAIGLVCLIYVVTLILIVWYILDKAYHDRDCEFDLAGSF